MWYGCECACHHLPYTHCVNDDGWLSARQLGPRTLRPHGLTETYPYVRSLRTLSKLYQWRFHMFPSILVIVDNSELYMILTKFLLKIPFINCLYLQTTAAGMFAQIMYTPSTLGLRHRVLLSLPITWRLLMPWDLRNKVNPGCVKRTLWWLSARLWYIQC